MSLINQTLSLILKKPSNVTLIENIIINSSDNPEQLCYEVVGLYFANKTKFSSKIELLKYIIELINENKIQWNHPMYDHFKHKQQEEDDFMANPYDIEEGVVECLCGSKRTFSFQKQLRSADEGVTTFSQCVECGKKWRHNN